MARGICLLIPLVLLVSACGGGGGESSATSLRSYAQLAENGQRLINRYENAAITSATAMPTSGSASYRGNAAFGPNAEVISDVVMNANFNAGGGDISGRLSNFRDYENTAYSGTVTAESATFTGDNPFTNNLTGAITADGKRLPVRGTMVSNFVGASAKAVRGDIHARLDGESVSGIYGAER